MINYPESLFTTPELNPKPFAMIHIERLEYSRSDTIIFKDLSFCAAQGEKVLLLGKSGTGKTSLFRLMLGFAQPTAGRIRINGMTLDKEHIRQIRGSVFYLSQDVDFPDQTGESIINTCLKCNHIKAPERDRLDMFLKVLSLSRELLLKKISCLSGGERQKLGLLIGLLLDRPVWLLDEPSSALDSQARLSLVRHITGLDKTILVISHDEAWQNAPGITIKEWH